MSGHCDCRRCSGRGRFSYSNVMSTLSVFLVIAGGTAIAASIPKNSVKSKSVQDNSLKGKDVKDGKLTGADVADDTLTGADVVESSLNIPQQELPTSLPPSGPAGGVLTGEYPNPGLGNNAVGSSEVANGSLTSSDVGISSGTTNQNFPSIAAGSCQGINVDLAGFQANDPVLVMPGVEFAGSATFNVEGRGSNNGFAIKACNPSGVAVDPDGAGGGTYHFVVFNNP